MVFFIKNLIFWSSSAKTYRKRVLFFGIKIAISYSQDEFVGSLKSKYSNEQTKYFQIWNLTKEHNIYLLICSFRLSAKDCKSHFFYYIYVRMIIWTYRLWSYGTYKDFCCWQIWNLLLWDVRPDFVYLYIYIIGTVQS